MTYKKELEDRLREVIVGTCNTIGCKNCGLKWEGGCSATDLQQKIMDEDLRGTEDLQPRR